MGCCLCCRNRKYSFPLHSIERWDDIEAPMLELKVRRGVLVGTGLIFECVGLPQASRLFGGDVIMPCGKSALNHSLKQTISRAFHQA